MIQGQNVRPTKKQRELLGFIDTFTVAHGYSPSYREIMRALDYKSVSTVATHINNLIERGHLRKRENSARSLEVLTRTGRLPPTRQTLVGPAQEKWLVDLIYRKFAQVEHLPVRDETAINELYVLIGALRILGFEGAAQACHTRLKTMLSSR